MRKSTWSALILMIFVGVSCVKTNPQREGDQERGGEKKTQTQGYPHSEEFRTTLLHGEHYLQDRQSCTQCHNGTSQAPVCTSCHQAYPHVDSMIQHGAQYTSDPQKCKNCHESPKGKSPSCTQCHTYPHEKEWSNRLNHGAAFLRDSNQCLSCHKSDGKGSKAVKSCQECHSYPHPQGWSLGPQHGGAFLENKKSNPENPFCLHCHDVREKEDGAGFGEEEKSVPLCVKCHNNYPHVNEWSKKELHAHSYLQNRNGCVGCHKGEGKSSEGVKSCQECHPYPHSPAWALPTNHGNAYVANKSDPKAFACTTCHYNETASAEMRGIPYCGSCHVEIPHPKGFRFKHKDVAATYQGGCTNCHVNFERHMPKRTTCTTCHLMHGGKTIEIHWINQEAHLVSPKSSKKATAEGGGAKELRPNHKSATP